MRPDRVRWFIMATLTKSVGTVFYSNQPDSPDECITIYSEPGTEVNVHSEIYIVPYQAIIRIAHNTAETAGETMAKTLLDAIRNMDTRADYHGAYLASAMNNVINPVTFAPDDNGGTPASKASVFTANDYALIDSEILKVTGVSGNNVTAARAQLGTTIAAHDDNSEIWNITKVPVPGILCDSTFAIEGYGDMGLDDKGRREFAVNWKVRLKP